MRDDVPAKKAAQNHGEQERRDDRPSLLDDGNGRRNPFLMVTFFQIKETKRANNNRPPRACLPALTCVLEMRQTVRYEMSATGVLKASSQFKAFPPFRTYCMKKFLS